MSHFKSQPMDLFGAIKVIPDERVPDNEIWACNMGVVDKILNLDTNEIKNPEFPIILEEKYDKENDQKAV